VSRRTGNRAGFVAVAASAAFLALVVPRPPARAEAGPAGYSFAGGSARERASVRAALEASAFDWRVVPGPVTIHITRGGGGCFAGRGEIWLDSELLAHGRAAWGIVQHEYAHEVDYFLLDSKLRTRLERLLGGKTWWPDGRFRHDQYGAERFASTLSYAYWPSPHNMLLRDAHAEATAMLPARFRRVLDGMLADRLS